MKIISGIYKGRNLSGFDIDGTRPTMDRVKESLFSMIQNNIKGSTVLDLFSGSGNLGLESLSEGASEAYLVDKNIKACKIMRENITKINIKNANILNMDYARALTYFKDNNITFDVIFLDPPYNTDLIDKSINLITSYNLLKEQGLIICESNALDKIIYSNNYIKIKEKRYGDKWVVILTKVC